MIKTQSYKINNLSEIEHYGEMKNAKDFRGLPSYWKMYYYHDDKIKICYCKKESVHVVINNSVPNHDKILNRILKIFKENL